MLGIDVSSTRNSALARGAGALAGCLTWIALVSAAGELSAEARNGFCVAVPHAIGDEEFGRRGRGHAFGSRHFDLYETDALELDVHCLRASPSELRVRLSLPNGDVYEILEAVPTETEETRQGRRSRREPIATARLAVLGSYITQYGLVGDWSATVCWHEAGRETCGPGRSFSLER